MLFNYLKTAWRSLRRSAGYTALNVAGLAAGLACVILIGLWVQEELTYDAFHEDADRTYRIVREWNLSNLEAARAITPNALAPALNEQVPDVDVAVRTTNREGVVEAGDQRFYEPEMLFADPGFLDVFDFPLVRGQAELDRPNTVLLTPEMASKYFPNRDAVGKTIQLNRPFEVTGIVAPPPSNSSLQFDFIASLKESPALESLSWGQNNYQTYVRLRPGATKESLNEHLASLVEKYIITAYEEGAGREAPENGFLMHAQPITGIHLGQGVPVDLPAEGSLTYVYLFSALALFVLLLACINFMNLATARSLRRSNEVGVRKAVGANGSQLVGQFLGESIVTTGISLAAAVGLCALVLPAFNDLAGKSFASEALFSPEHLAAYALLVLVVGVIAGSYPAFVLTRYAPTDTLRGRSSSSEGSPRLRQGLVIFQFAMSIVLLVGMLTVKKQVDFMTSKGLGFNEENVVVLDRTRQLGGQIDAVKQSLLQHASVNGVAEGFSMPGTFFINSMWQPDAPDAKQVNLNYSFVGPNYLDVLQVEMVAGRGHDPSRASDSSAVVLNRAAVSEFGWSPEEAVGKGLQGGPDGEPWRIIGVTENFHYESLREEIYPVALFHKMSSWQQRYLAVRIQDGQTVQAVDDIRSTWGSFSDLPFQHSFLASDLDAQYRAERRLGTLVTVFAGLAILIAVLGLLGLAAYSAAQRRKEIGIRKAMGATVRGIVGLLSKDFLLLVGLAFVLATPLGYYAVEQWLTRFPYRTDLGVSVFALAGVGAFLVAGAAVSYQAWKAARTDPVDALQSE